MWQYRGSTSLAGVTVDLDLREVMPAQPEPALGREERVELAILRSQRRFDRAMASGRYVFRPASGRADAVEMQRVADGRGVSFDPPFIVPVD